MAAKKVAVKKVAKKKMAQITAVRRGMAKRKSSKKATATKAIKKSDAILKIYVGDCTPKIIKKVPQMYTEGQCDKEVALELGITRETLEMWMQGSDDFRKAVEHGRRIAEGFWMRKEREHRIIVLEGART